MSDAPGNPASESAELRQLVEETASQLEQALDGGHAGPIQTSSKHPLARRLGEAVNRLLQVARQGEARAAAIARDRDDVDRDLVEVQERLASEITSGERAARAAVQQRAVLRSVVDAFPYCIFWKDRDGVYLGANENKVRALGLQSVDELIGKTDYDTAISREDADFYRTVDRRVMDSGEPILNLEETQQRPDGPHVLLTTKVPLRDDAGVVTGILGMYVDVTERTRMDGSGGDEKALESMRGLLRLRG
jgi:PAS domain S-box-containing protein